VAGPTSIVYMPVAGERLFDRLAKSVVLSTELVLTWHGRGCDVGRMEPEAEDGPTVGF
jgi:hypothetical protein